MKDIIVVGYPKSGNTWITRLTAELVNCPVTGFWQSAHWEYAQEGQDRVSEFQCYKAHHQLHELKIDPEKTDTKIIYVVRDPRDIVVSGANYFRFQRSAFLEKVMYRIPGLGKWWDKTGYAWIHPESYRIERMVNAVLFGDRKIHGWVRIPWSAHYRPYLNNNTLFIRYETVLAQPYEASCAILEHLGLERSAEFINNAITKQSFKKRKEDFVNSGNHAQAQFLRKGKNEQWRTKLTSFQKQLFNQHLADDLKRFSYSLTVFLILGLIWV
jgi:hypothetical protein